jgi:hypothetical protein
MNNIFKVNEAGWDRAARIVLGIVLLVVGFGGLIPGTAGIVVGVVGLIPLLTGLIGFCPLYAPFNFSTKKN